MIEITNNNITYQLDNEKVSIVEKRDFLGYLSVILLICFLIVFLYDYVKDILRVLSGYKDIFKGQETSGAVKLTGYTKQNMIRNIAMFVLGGLAIVSSYFSVSYIPIDIKDVPKEVIEEYNKQK